MGDLLTPVQTTRKAKGSVEKSETLSRNDGARSALEVIEISSQNTNGPPKDSRHKKLDSTAFLQQAYLKDDSSSTTLPDDAREILKSQPDQKDFIAVLRYFQYGIDGKHDFNVRAPGPKASQILNVLVTITIPDRWASLNTKPLSREDKEARSMLLSCLICVAGLGALHAQIKRLTGLTPSTESAKSLMLKDVIDVLADVLHPSSLIQRLLGDTLNLHTKPGQRPAIWQELSSLLMGGKILSAVAQALPLAEVGNNDKSTVEWLADGSKYCKWLASNICYAAAQIPVSEGEAWPMLAQLLKRGLTLGHSGKSSIYRLVKD